MTCFSPSLLYIFIMVMTRGSGLGTSDLERSGPDDEEIGEFIVIEVSTTIRDSI